MDRIALYRPPLISIDKNLLNLSLRGDQKKLLEEFEAKAARKLGVPYAIAVANPVLAMHLALYALDMKRGDKMIATVNAHPGIGQTIRQFDSKLIFCDIESDTFNISLDLIEPLLEDTRSQKVRGVICSLAAGQADDFKRLYSMTRKRGMVTIVEGFGAYGLEMSLADKEPDLYITSIVPLELPAAANIGIIATFSKKLRDRAVLIRNYALNYTASYIYDMVEVGCAYMPSAIDLAYAISLMPCVEKAITRRRVIARRYDRAFAQLKHVTPPVKKYAHSYCAYIVKIDKNRDGFAKSLIDRGIEAEVNYIPLHLMSYYRSKYAIKITDFPRALANYHSILSIPIYSDMKDKEVSRVIDAISEIDRSRVW
ncbi:MAG: DegT/DnrJ/EryC1/StrS aminotransferase family protein [Helicobacteraceae bacterium]|nr:DegT/DnrJ/EryC1/StrS aminotransferase family protein [Helicobacteraceae bacterium]